MMKILVATPYHARLYDATLDCILSLDAACHVVDKLLTFGGDSSIADPRDRIAAKQERTRRIALAGGYDYLLFIEEDMIVAPDSLLKLIDASERYKLDVVYSLYSVRKVPHWWCCSVRTVRDHGTAKITRLSDDPLAAKQAYGNIITCQGLGFGCTLIKASVLEKVSFRRGSDNQFSDWYFAYDCEEAGFKQGMHLGNVCGHILDDHRYVVPSVDNDNLYSIRELA